MDHARAAYTITARAREHYATDLFDLKQVRQAIERRAADGFRDFRVVQQQPFDLSRSAPARALENWLEDNHYRYVWTPTPPAHDPLRSSHSEDYPELAIFW
jgi:hypothetical protein